MGRTTITGKGDVFDVIISFISTVEKKKHFFSTKFYSKPKISSNNLTVFSCKLKDVWKISQDQINNVAITKSVLINYSELFYLLIFTLLFATTVKAQKPNSNMAEEFAKKGNEFSFDLYSKIIKGKQSENVIISPFSIQTCVALAYEGAAGKTAEEMSTGLRLVANDRLKVGESFKQIMDTYADSPLLKIANKIFIKNGYGLKEEFNEIAKKNFHSEAENIDFSASTEAASKMNTWVEKKTNSKIKDIIDPGSLNADTRLVLLNAIYFKGDWETKFPKENTKKEPFYINEKDSIEVDMMQMKNKFLFGNLESLSATALEMPFRNSDLSMLFILPNERTGLTSLESKLSNIDLMDTLSQNMYKMDVNIMLPKFKIEFSIKLNDALKEMGMNSMFNNGDFSNLLCEMEPLAVSEVVHKAFIEVNEDGAEAAAATGTLIEARAMPLEFPFIADHPFLFVIWNRKTNLFTGRFNPAATAESICA